MNTLRLVERSEPAPAKKDYINKLRASEPKTGCFIIDFILDMVRRKSVRMSPNYKNNYHTLIYHLNKFSSINDVDLFTNSINEAFLDDFIGYLQDENLRLNYIKNTLVLLKSTVKKAAIYGYAVDPTYEDVDVDQEETFAVYLSMNEITRIYYYEGLTKKQQKIRDLFVLGCLTGLRFSDYSTLTPENFQGDEIIKVTKKTNKKVIIPIHDYVREIYLKYGNNIPGEICTQHFNRYIQMICKKIGINQKVTFSYTKGGVLKTDTKEKWQMIASHTARRSFATNMYLTGRWQTFQIMAITGHTTEESFFRYIRITKTDVARQMAGDSFFRK